MTLEPLNPIFDGAVSNASAPPDSPRPDCHDRRHVRRDLRVRFRAERTVAILDFVTAGAAQAAAQPQAESVRRLSIDEAVKLAIEQNLGIRIQRFDPQIQDIGIAQARSFWAPNLTTSFNRNSQTQQSTSTLAGSASEHRSTSRLRSGRSSTRRCRGAAATSATWNSSRFTTTNLFSSFSPQLGSNLNLQYLAAAAAQLRDRSDSPAGGEQQEEPRAVGHPARAASSRRRCAPCGTRTGICRSRSTT